MTPLVRRALFAALGAFCLAGGAPFAAADEKPALEVNTKTIEASLGIEASLKAFPGLYDNLLAEGRRAVAKWRTQADSDRKDTPDIFREGRRYAYERKYTQRSAIAGYVTVLRSDYMNSLGAHPNRETDTILWDVNAKKRVSIRPFFKETADNGPTMTAIAAAIRAALVVEKKKRDTYEKDDSGIASVQPSLLKIGAIALAPSNEANKSSGLVAYFSPYAVGAYAEGDYTVFVPWLAFKQYLLPEGAGLFGGERPADDAKNDE